MPADAGSTPAASTSVYPDVSLKDAREARDEAKRLLGKGIDPSAHRRAERSAQTLRETNAFENVAREWHIRQSSGWTEKHASTVISRLENNVFPWLGHRPAASISASELLETIRRIEQRGAIETAHRVLAICGQVLRYAVATARAERDVSADLRGALTPVKLELTRFRG